MKPLGMQRKNANSKQFHCESATSSVRTQLFPLQPVYVCIQMSTFLGEKGSIKGFTFSVWLLSISPPHLLRVIIFTQCVVTSASHHTGEPPCYLSLGRSFAYFHWLVVAWQPPALLTLHVQAQAHRVCLMCWKFHLTLLSSPISLSSSFLSVASDCLQIPPLLLISALP